MLDRSKQAIIKRLLAALEEWDCCPAYERRWITGWIRTTGCLMEQCNRSDDQGARIPFDAAADLLTEVALALNELRPMQVFVPRPYARSARRRAMWRVRMSKRKERISARQFIDVWQTSSSVDEAATRLQIGTGYAHSRASWFRTKKNIPLKSFPRKKGGGRKMTDWEALREFAKSLAAREMEGE